MAASVNTSKTIVRGESGAKASGQRTDRNGNPIEPSEFDGFWLNFALPTADGEAPIRLPLGVAVGDLKTKKLYASMDADFAAKTSMQNNAVTLIQRRCIKDGKPAMAEGEYVKVNLDVYIYRRMEELETPVEATPEVATLEAVLFG